jgi:hypothetical protein
MVNENLKNRILKFIENAEVFYGRKLKINESISTNSINFNRHFTTSNSLSFTVINIACRISGGRIMLQGEELYYEIAIDLLVDFIEKENQEFEFLEQYSETVYRKTILKIFL